MILKFKDDHNDELYIESNSIVQFRRTINPRYSSVDESTEFCLVQISTGIFYTVQCNIKVLAKVLHATIQTDIN